MNRADEGALAWALADTAGPLLTAEARVSFNMKIGAGELDGAVVDLLTFYGRNGVAIPGDLVVALDAWVAGYAGAPVEAQLRRLVERIPRRTPPTTAGTSSSE